MDVNAYLRNAYQQQFLFFYFKKPTEEQLNVYEDFYLRKNTDINKVVDFCHIVRRADGVDSLSMVDKTSREDFKRKFKLTFIFEPNELQLDVFISYRLGVIPDLALVYEVNKEKRIKEMEQCEMINQ